jgi:hypothetical protein
MVGDITLPPDSKPSILLEKMGMFRTGSFVEDESVQNWVFCRR